MDIKQAKDKCKMLEMQIKDLQANFEKYNIQQDEFDKTGDMNPEEILLEIGKKQETLIKLCLIINKVNFDNAEQMLKIIFLKKQNKWIEGVLKKDNSDIQSLYIVPLSELQEMLQNNEKEIVSLQLEIDEYESKIEVEINE